MVMPICPELAGWISSTGLPWRNEKKITEKPPVIKLTRNGNIYYQKCNKNLWVIAIILFAIYARVCARACIVFSIPKSDPEL